MKLPTVLILFLLFFGVASPAQANGILVVAEENPPFCYTIDGQPNGIAVELFREMARKARLDYSVEDIRFWPWARGYQEVQNNRNTILFPMARTKARESLVQWIGPIHNLTASFMARKASGIQFKTVQQASRKYRIGTIRDSAGEQLLLSMGVSQENLHSVHSIDLNVRKLVKGRIDILLVNESAFNHSLKSMGYAPETYEVVQPFLETTLYFAANKDMDKELVRRLQAALDGIMNSGQHRTILSQYEK